MRSSIVLYKTYDADLLGLLYQVGKRDFLGILRDALKKSLNSAYIPKMKIPSIIYPYNGEESKVVIPLCFTSKRDMEINTLLQNITAGKLGQFVKAVLRFYIGSNRILACYTENTYTHTFNLDNENTGPVIERVIERIIERPVEPVNIPKIEDNPTEKPVVPVQPAPAIPAAIPAIKEETPIVKEEPVFIAVKEEEPEEDLGLSIYGAEQGVSEDTNSEEDDILRMLDNL